MGLGSVRCKTVFRGSWRIWSRSEEFEVDLKSWSRIFWFFVGFVWPWVIFWSFWEKYFSDFIFAFFLINIANFLGFFDFGRFFWSLDGAV